MNGASDPKLTSFHTEILSESEQFQLCDLLKSTNMPISPVPFSFLTRLADGPRLFDPDHISTAPKLTKLHNERVGPEFH